MSRARLAALLPPGSAGCPSSSAAVAATRPGREEPPVPLTRTADASGRATATATAGLGGAHDTFCAASSRRTSGREASPDASGGGARRYECSRKAPSSGDGMAAQSHTGPGPPALKERASAAAGSSTGGARGRPSAPRRSSLPPTPAATKRGVSEAGAERRDAPAGEKPREIATAVTSSLCASVCKRESCAALSRAAPASCAGSTRAATGEGAVALVTIWHVPAVSVATSAVLDAGCLAGRRAAASSAATRSSTASSAARSLRISSSAAEHVPRSLLRPKEKPMLVGAARES
mmetsp:Transcript_32784/g.109442  ORF Transcript_32784/g.109442 Transcript_32784/m.109442 type:complete len:292 (-) Transcript_32784:7-882(-)